VKTIRDFTAVVCIVCEEIMCVCWNLNGGCFTGIVCLWIDLKIRSKLISPNSLLLKRAIALINTIRANSIDNLNALFTFPTLRTVRI